MTIKYILPVVIIAALFCGAIIYVMFGNMTSDEAYTDPLDESDGPVASFNIENKEAESGSRESAINTEELREIESVQMDLHGEFNRQASMGQIIAEGRTRNYINRLDLESLDDSLSLLDEAGYFYYPGHYPQSFSPRPIDHIHTILSNRRVIKLYQDLLLLNENDRSEVLLDAFENYLTQYQTIAAQFAINSPQLHEHGYLEWSRISDGEDLPRTAVGTRHALQSLAILMSILGGDEVLAPLQKAFESPLIGAPIQEEAYDAKMLQMMRHSPLFPKEIQVQVAYHLLGSEARANMPQANVETLRVPNYKSQVTRYDILHRAGQPVDYQHGFYDLEFVTVVDQSLIDRFMSSGGTE